MAVLSIFYTDASATFYWRIFIVGELAGYLIITIFCLRSIFFLVPFSGVSSEEVVLRAKKITDKRVYTYRVALSATVALTVIFLVFLIQHQVLNLL